MNMMLRIKQREYNLSFEQVSQWCGKNVLEKQKIVGCLTEYFGSAKVLQEENDVFIEGQQVGRKYFQVFCIKDRESLLEAIKIGKNTLLSQYIKRLLNEFGIQEDMNKIDQVLWSVFEQINVYMHKLGNIELQYSTQQIWDIVQKTELTGCVDTLDNLSNYELLTVFINLVNELQQFEPGKQLVMFPNLDHMITSYEYQNIYDLCSRIVRQYDLWFIFLTSLDDYAIVTRENIESICVFNTCFFQFVSYEKIEKYIKSSYPIEKKWTDEKILCYIRNILHEIGNDAHRELESELLLKMLNDTLCVHGCWKKRPIQAEIDFMMSKSMV